MLTNYSKQILVADFVSDFLILSGAVEFSLFKDRKLHVSISIHYFPVRFVAGA